MNLSALPQLLAAWLRTQGAVLLEPGKTTPAPARDTFQPGATYQGKVLENLTAGRSLVQVGGQQLSMALPRGAQAGDTLRLTFINNLPRPTFVMQQPALSGLSGTQPVRLSQTAQQLTALAQLAKPAAPSGPPPTRPGPVQIAQAGVASQRPILGSTAPLLSPPSLGGTSTSLPMTALTSAFASATALAGGAPVDAARSGLAAGSATSNLAALQAGGADSTPALPQRLHQTLRESGLFYEAHQARWTRGTFELAELRLEPQARLAEGGHVMATAAGLTDMPEEAARLAGRQLLMLEGAPFLWQGFAWPGQWLEWQVQEQAGGDPGSGEENHTWATELRLTLPNLGGITARLSLAGASLTVGLSALDPSTRTSLNAALPDLERLLEAAGLQPAGLSVSADAADA